MSLAATRFGRSPTAPTAGLPRSVYYWLVATLAMFILANAFASPVTALINAGKWLPLGGLLVFSLSVMPRLRTPECPPIMLFSLVAFFMLAITSAFFGIRPLVSLGSLASVVIVVLAGYAVAAIIVATGSKRQFFDLIANIGRVLVATTLLFYLARANLGRGGGFSAWVDNPNTLASIMAPGCIVFMAGCLERRPGWQYKHLAFLVIGLPLLYVTQGRATFLWVIISAGAFWIYRRGRWPTGIALTIAAIALIGWWEPISQGFMHWAQLDIAPERASGVGPLSGREEVWRVGMELFGERPVFGYGMGSSITLIRDQAWRFVRFEGSHFHSSYIMALVEVGLLGFLVFMAAMVATLTRGIADTKRTQVLPRDSWPTAALPFVMFAGMLGHALFESWLLAGGNVNSPLLWIIVWLIHFQTQVPVRAVAKPGAAPPAARPGLAAQPR
jgi:O-antigen ligase